MRIEIRHISENAVVATLSNGAIGRGRTTNEAVGDLVMTHYEEFNVEGSITCPKWIQRLKGWD